MDGGTDSGKIGWESFVVLIFVESDISFVYVISKLGLDEMAFHVETEKQGGKIAYLVVVCMSSKRCPSSCRRLVKYMEELNPASGLC